MIMERLVDFLRQLLIRHDELKKGQDTMTATTQQILDKLTAQGAQIDSLIAARDAKEQADLDQISSLIDTNGAKVTAALAPAGSGVGSSTVTVVAPTNAPTTVLPVSTDTPPVVGSLVSGPGIASGTTVASASATSITLDTPTTADHSGNGSETLTVTPPAAS